MRKPEPTYGYWRNKFCSDRSVLGRAIDVDGKPRAIIGVLPQSFSFVQDQHRDAFANEVHRAKDPPGRLQLASQPGQARGHDCAGQRRRGSDDPDRVSKPPTATRSAVKDFENLQLVLNLLPLRQEVVGNVDKLLWVVFGGIGLVLLIACANVANLLLVRAEGRQQELVIRAALGATRSRIASELLAESLILGGSVWRGIGSRTRLRSVAGSGCHGTDWPARLPCEIGIDGRIVLFAPSRWRRWPRADSSAQFPYSNTR